MISVHDLVIPDGSRVILDFDKRLVFYRNETFRIEWCRHQHVNGRKGLTPRTL